MDVIDEYDGAQVHATAARSDGNLVGVLRSFSDGPGLVVQDQEGNLIDGVTFPQGSGPGAIGDQIADIAVDANDNIVVVDGANDRIQVFDEGFELVMTFGTSGAGPGQFGDAVSVAVDSAGRIIVGDREHDRVSIFLDDGTFLGSFGSTGVGAGLMLCPGPIAATPDDDIVVADCESFAVQVFDSSGGHLHTIREGEVPDDDHDVIDGLVVNSLGEILIGWSSSYGGDCCRYSMIQAFGADFGFLWSAVNDGAEIYDYPNGAELAVTPDDKIIQTEGHGSRYTAVWAYRECFGRRATLLGTDGDDMLIGTDGDDVIVGLAGDDVLVGGKGNDRLCSGPGNDELRGAGGNDRMIGKAGDDLLLGGNGRDRLVGGTGSDVLIGYHGDDTLKGNRGNDELRGDWGEDRLFGGGGHDVLEGGPDADVLNGGGGSDLCPDVEAIDTVSSC
jgi:Ca2+-binding RTX toxin-like protein